MKPLARAAIACWVSEASHVAEWGMRVAGDYKKALFYKTRSIVAQDRALRELDEASEDTKEGVSK